MPTLYQQLKKLPWAAVPAVSAVSTDHGRRARRTIKAVLAPAWIEFDGAAQVAQLRRTVTKKGKKTVEVVYLITSDRDAGPATLAAWVRGHWEIENQPPLGPRRHLPGRQIPGQDRKRAPRHGNTAQPGHQPPAPGRPRQHRRRQPPPRPRPAAHAHAASDRMNDFAGSLSMGMSASKLASESAGHCKTRIYRTCACRSVGRWAKVSRHLYTNVERLSFLRSDGQGAFSILRGNARDCTERCHPATVPRRRGYPDSWRRPAQPRSVSVAADRPSGVVCSSQWSSRTIRRRSGSSCLSHAGKRSIKMA